MRKAWVRAEKLCELLIKMALAAWKAPLAGPRLFLQPTLTQILSSTSEELIQSWALPDTGSAVSARCAICTKWRDNKSSLVSTTAAFDPNHEVMQ
jgi:hypothetical protein